LINIFHFLLLLIYELLQYTQHVLLVHLLFLFKFNHPTMIFHHSSIIQCRCAEHNAKCLNFAFIHTSGNFEQAIQAPIRIPCWKLDNYVLNSILLPSPPNARTHTICTKPIFLGCSIGARDVPITNQPNGMPSALFPRGMRVDATTVILNIMEGGMHKLNT
jgi:hypothetical protein